MTDFDTFWKIYPHWSTRSNKPASRVIFAAITSLKGHNGATLVEGTRIKINIQDTPENIILGTKAYRMQLTEEKWAKGAQVFLNQGAFIIDDAEALAARWDRIQTKVKEIEAKGNVVPLSG